MHFLTDHDSQFDAAQVVYFYSAAAAYDAITSSYEHLLQAIEAIHVNPQSYAIPKSERFALFRMAWEIVESADTLRQVIDWEGTFLAPHLTDEVLQKDLSQSRLMRNGKVHFPQNTPQQVEKAHYVPPMGFLSWTHGGHSDSKSAIVVYITAEAIPDNRNRSYAIDVIGQFGEVAFEGKTRVHLWTSKGQLDLTGFFERTINYAETLRPVFEKHAAGKVSKNEDRRRSVLVTIAANLVRS